MEWPSTSTIVAADESRLIISGCFRPRGLFIGCFERTHVRCYRSEWRSRDVSSVWSERGSIELPEFRPEIFLQRMHRRIPRNNCAGELPFFRMPNQAVLSCVVDDVKANPGKNISSALLCSHDVIVCLMLETMRLQLRRKVLAQEFHSVLLIAVPLHAHPDQMNVVGHQAIGGAEKFLARSGVKHDFAEVSVKGFVQPACTPHVDGHGPVNDGIGLIIFAWQPLQIEIPICARTSRRICGVRLLGWFHFRLERTHVRCYQRDVAADVSRLILFPVNSIFAFLRQKFERTYVRCYRLKIFATRAFTLSSIRISGGQGRLKPSPAIFFVASMPSLLPMAISLVA